jgi:23S rRNA (cytosine1962-C5)-methyltransferase
MTVVRLKPGHVQPVWVGHPWIYAQAVDGIDGESQGGDEVSVVDPRGNLLGRGFYSPGSAIPVRILVRDATTAIDRAFFRQRIERAVESRRTLDLPNAETSGFRLVNAEGDGLPGLTVDRYADVLAVQFGTSGMKLHEAEVLDALEDVVAPRAIIDRTSPRTAASEGFESAGGVVRGGPVEALEFRERGFAFRIPITLGQKTGFYFDQRQLRGRVEQLARGASRVLDAYAFVGAFAMAAVRGGALEVMAVEESAAAVEIGVACAKQNGLADRITFARDDVRRVFASHRAEFDLVVADPPRLAPTRSARGAALVAYARLAENVCRATRPGGHVVLCSCSAAVDLDALTRALATGAVRSDVTATVVERSFQGPDHPVPAAFDEGLYLKALVARVDAR